jgi:hypothetical protein
MEAKQRAAGETVLADVTVRPLCVDPDVRMLRVNERANGEGMKRRQKEGLWCVRVTTVTSERW